MAKKRTYHSVDVESFNAQRLLEQFPEGCEVVVGLDVAKRKFLAAFTSTDGNIAEILKFDHPMSTRTFLGVIEGLLCAGRRPVVVMEPTGTYGDAMRHQFSLLQVPVYRVSTKHVSDSAELYDSVPSKHDAKDACVIAWLHTTKRSARWVPTSPEQRRLRALVAQRDLHDVPLRRLYNQLEPLVVRHFPELEGFFDLSRRRTPLVLLEAYPSPASIAKAGAQRIRDLISRTSRRQMTLEDAERFVQAAARTLGEPMLAEESQLIRRLVTEMLHLLNELKQVDQQIEEVGRSIPAVVAMRPVLGATTAAVIVAHMGSPGSYSSAGAFEKATGLNLREHSSGTHKGRLSISKRGPSRVRKYLYLAAMRLVQSDPIVKAWYVRRRAYTEEVKLKALLAVVRKLARALVHVARGAQFDARLLFDVRRLELTSPTAQESSPMN